MANGYTGSKIGSPETYALKFRLLAEKKGPNFKYVDAVRAGAWTTHIGTKLGISYNGMRQLAGLPIMVLGRHQREEAKKRMPKVQPQKATKGPLVNQCLGLDIYGQECNKKLPKGQHFCTRCKARKDSL